MASDRVKWVGWLLVVHSTRTAVTAVASLLIAVIPAVGSVLGADYNSRDHAVITVYSVQRFLAEIRRNCAWSVSWCDCGESAQAARACIRYLRVHPGAALRRGAFGSKRISLRGRHAGHCAVGAANGF